MTWTDAARRVKRLRRTLGVTQPELAQLVGVSAATISRIETARDTNPPNTTTNTLIAIAELMHPDEAHAFLNDVGRGDLVDELNPPPPVEDTVGFFERVVEQQDQIIVMLTDIRDRLDSASA